MTDAGFSYLTMAVWIIVLSAYGIRVARFGSFNSSRVTGFGDSVLVGQNVMQATYWAIDPLVRGLVRLGATPNGVTWTALVLGGGAGVALAFGWFGLACLLATISTISDILDGQIARVLGVGSARGELLDAAVDRYTEFAFIAGFLVFARDSVIEIGIALSALLASYMISYSSAKADGLQVKAPRGLMRRHERAIYVTIGAGITPLVGPIIHAHFPSLPWDSAMLLGLGLVGLVGNYSAVDRFMQISRELPAPPARTDKPDRAPAPGDASVS